MCKRWPDWRCHPSSHPVTQSICSQYTGDFYTVDLDRKLGDCRGMADPSIQVQFGKRVRALREAKGHSQEAFAAIANIDRGAFGKLERGEVNVGLISIARIAVALDLDLSQLMQEISVEPEEIRAIPRSERGPKPLGSRD